MNTTEQSTPTVCKIGMWVSLALAVETIAFGIALLFSTANDAAYLASLFIAPSFVALMVAIHYTASPHKRVWSHLGLSFAIIYAVLCTLNYYIQLTAVRVNDLGIPQNLMKVFAFTPGSVMFAQDMLGYAFLCLSTLVTAPVFTGNRLAAWIKWLFVGHGLVFFVPLVFPALSFSQDATGDEIGVIANLGWCLLFAPIALLLVVYFKRWGASNEP
jgi:hypothetical protein